MPGSFFKFETPETGIKPGKGSSTSAIIYFFAEETITAYRNEGIEDAKQARAVQPSSSLKPIKLPIITTRHPLGGGATAFGATLMKGEAFAQDHWRKHQPQRNLG